MAKFNDKVKNVMNSARETVKNAPMAEVKAVAYKGTEIKIGMTAAGNAVAFKGEDNYVMGQYNAGTGKFTWFGTVPLRARVLIQHAVRGKYKPVIEKVAKVKKERVRKEKKVAEVAEAPAAE